MAFTRWLLGAQFAPAPPQHRLCFLPEPQGQGQGSLRPTLGAAVRPVSVMSEFQSAFRSFAMRTSS
jgi:hypothetical protein